MIRLLDAGVSAEVVAEKISMTRNRQFNTEPEELIRRKSANVPDNVILAIIAPVADHRSAQLVKSETAATPSSSETETIVVPPAKPAATVSTLPLVCKTYLLDKTGHKICTDEK